MRYRYLSIKCGDYRCERVMHALRNFGVNESSQAQGNGWLLVVLNDIGVNMYKSGKPWGDYIIERRKQLSSDVKHILVDVTQWSVSQNSDDDPFEELP